MVKTLPAVEKLDSAYLEKATMKNGEEEVTVREFDPKFMRRTTRKVRRSYLHVHVTVLTLAVGHDRHASLDSNLPHLVAGQV